ncbi:MAG: hypothetical protein JWR27_98 [Aeromicrobium sp.]|jgi:hypothetical protein|nr:hypothetical protein [Aeromicrobium sp.]
MIRTVALLVTTSVAATVLAGCGGDSAYCAAVKEHESALKSYGKRSNASFTSSTAATRDIGKVAPAEVKKQWSQITAATDGVLAAHRQAGISLQDMTDPAKLAGLDEADRATIQKSYDRFNQSRTPRKAVVKNIEDECEIRL